MCLRQALKLHTYTLLEHTLGLAMRHGALAQPLTAPIRFHVRCQNAVADGTTRGSSVRFLLGGQAALSIESVLQEEGNAILNGKALQARDASSSSKRSRSATQAAVAAWSPVRRSSRTGKAQQPQREDLEMAEPAALLMQRSSEFTHCGGHATR